MPGHRNGRHPRGHRRRPRSLKIADLDLACKLATHPEVDRVAVVGVPAPVIGEIGVAFVVRSGTESLTEAGLRAWCRDRIADYKIPDTVVFVDDLPVNATFKVDTRRLKEMAASLQNV